MQWLTDNWHSLFPYPWGSISLSILALLCGAWVGIERQRKEKPAGIRTMALIALGSAAFTMVGYAFTSSNGDSGRVAAQIVTGVGFLGGGVLLRGTTSIHGVLTVVNRWECSKLAGATESVIRLIVDPAKGKTEVKLENLLEQFEVRPKVIERKPVEDHRELWVIRVLLPRRSYHELLMTLVEQQEVYSIER